MKHTLSTFEAENRCLDKLAQPELKKRGCLYKKMCTPKNTYWKQFCCVFCKGLQRSVLTEQCFAFYWHGNRSLLEAVKSSQLDLNLLPFWPIRARHIPRDDSFKVSILSEDPDSVWTRVTMYNSKPLKTRSKYLSKPCILAFFFILTP